MKVSEYEEMHGLSSHSTGCASSVASPEKLEKPVRQSRSSMKSLEGIVSTNALSQISGNQESKASFIEPSYNQSESGYDSSSSSENDPFADPQPPEHSRVSCKLSLPKRKLMAISEHSSESDSWHQQSCRPNKDGQESSRGMQRKIMPGLQLGKQMSTR